MDNILNKENSMTTAQAIAQAPAKHEDLKMMSNAIRALAMDAVQAANSGHPGMPMGMADVATVLYSNFLKFNAMQPEWADRDRFVLSAGHGSMLLYALNYLTGYKKITLDQIKNFRQLGYITAGHPEVEFDAGIETTTGPLGQGISTAVGMAIAERNMNARFGDSLVDHHTYVIASDGDLMEGISHEACSLAGHLKLDRLIVLYDDNGISIDGSTDLSFIDDTSKRFEAYGWDVQSIDGHNYEQIESAIAKAKETATPSIICCKTHIGFGAPTKQGSSSSHGAPLGEDEIKGTRENLNWPYDSFEVPEDILNQWREVGAQNNENYEAWQTRLSTHAREKEFIAALTLEVEEDLGRVVQELKKHFAAEKPSHATRKTSGTCLEKIVEALPVMIGGSADLTGSNNTKVKISEVLDSNNYGGNYINYGVREHGMAAAMNGMALHGGIVPYAGTFLQFADYSRPAIRLAALMEQRVIHVMTHDSIGLGEDGPTHQPVEHLAALRAIPNVMLFRPCDGIETAESWELAIRKSNGPSVMALTRQGIPTLCEARAENHVAKGAYVLKEQGDSPEISLFASGSEVSIAHEAYEELAKEGKAIRLISVPCMDLLLNGDGEHYQSLVCNNSIKIAVEAGIRQGWDAIIGAHNPFIGMTGFGASAPAEDLYKHFGITTEAVLAAVRKKLG